VDIVSIGERGGIDRNIGRCAGGHLGMQCEDGDIIFGKPISNDCTVGIVHRVGRCGQIVWQVMVGQVLEGSGV